VANEETFSFQEALNELHLEEEELKRLVSEGEIRAFREGEDMRLRREDVETLRSELGGDIAFEDDDFADAGMATEEISAADTLIDDIEDVGEIEDIEDLDEEEDDDDDVPIATAVAVDEPFEGMGTRIAMIATFVVLFMALPLFMAMATGQVGGIARGIAGIFVPEMKE